MVAIFSLPSGFPMSLKVEPGLFDILAQQPGIIPAPNHARHGWVQMEDVKVLPQEQLESLIEASHQIISRKLSKKRQKKLGIIPM